MRVLYPLTTFIFLTFSNLNAQPGRSVGDTFKVEKHNGVVLKKGIYKTYKEFKDNNPSITYPFLVDTLAFYHKKKDTIVAYNYFFIDSNLINTTAETEAELRNVHRYQINSRYNDQEDSNNEIVAVQNKNTPRKLRRIWGICDGENVYVRTYQKWSSHFWKLDYLGQYPMFDMAESNSTIVVFLPVSAVGVAVSAAIFAASTSMNVAELSTNFVSANGNIVKLNGGSVRKVLKLNDAQLLREFEVERKSKLNAKRNSGITPASFKILYKKYLIALNDKLEISG